MCLKVVKLRPLKGTNFRKNKRIIQTENVHRNVKKMFVSEVCLKVTCSAFSIGKREI